MNVRQNTFTDLSNVAIREVESHIQLGQLYSRKSSLSKACYHYQQALELNSQLPEIHYNLAVIFQTWGEWDFAAHHYQAAIAHQPSYAKAYFNWGVLNVNQGRYALAAACYQQAIAYQPDYLNAYLNLGSLLLHQKDEESAIIFYQKAIELFPSDARLHNNLGKILHQQNKDSAAFQAYEVAVRLDSSFSTPHRNRGQLWLKHQDSISALVCYRNAAQLSSSPQSWGDVAGVAFDQGDFWVGLEALKNAITCFPESSAWVEAYCSYAFANTSGNRFCLAQQSCARLLQALQLNDLSTAKQWLFQTYCDSAAIAFEAKAFYKAETLYQRAIALQPQVQDFYSKLATCLAQRGRTIAATAIAHLGQTLRQDTLDSVDSNIVAPQHHLVVPSGHNHRSPGCGVTCDRCMGDLIQAFRPHQLAAGVFQCDLKAGPQFPLPPQTLTQIPHGRAWVEPRQSDWVACHEVRVTTSDDRPIPELCRSYPWRLPNCKAQPAVVDSEVVDSERSELEQRCDRQSLPPPQTFAGTAVLLSTLSGHVYYHWMIDLLPRIGLLRQGLQKQKLTFDQIDHFIVNSLEAKFQRETLQHLGIPLEKVIESDRVPHLHAETLWVPSFPGQLDWIPPATIDFLRQQFLPKAAQNGTQTHPKRIYISRQGARYRRVLNEDQVLEILRPYGFVSVSLEELSVCEQAALFAQAEIIVAPHGSGLTNLVFCQPHTQILELFSPRYLRTDYWMVSQSLQLEHHYIVGRSLPCAPLRDLMYQSPLVEDIYVEPASLRSAIRQISP